VSQKRIGVYPGTFDPITKGHIDIVKRALCVVDTLYIAVADDIPKTPVFTLDERTEMVREDMEALEERDRVFVEPFEGLLTSYAMEKGASVIIRGLRAISDFEYEMQMACMNNKLEPDVETVFLPASENTQFISSRFVKEIARLGGDVSCLVSPHVKKMLERRKA